MKDKENKNNEGRKEQLEDIMKKMRKKMNK